MYSLRPCFWCWCSGSDLDLQDLNAVRRKALPGKKVTSGSCCRLGTALTVSGPCKAVGPLCLPALDLLWEVSMPEPPRHAPHSHRLLCPPVNWLLHTSQAVRSTQHILNICTSRCYLLELRFPSSIGMQRITQGSPGIALALSP